MLSLVLPTYNEAESLPALIREIGDALRGHAYEIIIVDDDSPDCTWEIAGKLGKHVRVIRRVGRRGLSSAVVEGFAAAKGDVLAVMDADGQHDPKILLRMTELVRKHRGLVLGSRYIEGGSVEGWVESRHFLSRVATACARLVMTARVSDPMSGFFALDQSLFERIKNRLRPRGFKILLEVVSWLPPKTHVDEVPLVFRVRKAGASKLNAKIELLYLWQVVTLLCKGRGQSPWMAFALLHAILFASFLPRIMAIGAIYRSPEAASRVRSAVERMTEEQGWILSDVALLEVREGGMRLLHRQHHRGRDERSCYDVAFGSSTLRSCRDE